MDWVTDATHKAEKLEEWVDGCKYHKSESVNTILRIIHENKIFLDYLQTQVRGMNSARTDIINGGPRWWLDSHKGITNVFSAISIRPRKATDIADTFKGLLGVSPGCLPRRGLRASSKGIKSKTSRSRSFASCRSRRDGFGRDSPSAAVREASGVGSPLP